MEEGGNRQDHLRNAWRKLVESEERLRFWKKMVGWEVGVREIEHLGEDLKEKFRSMQMKEGQSERKVISLVMGLKLKDEKKLQRELKREKERRRKDLEKGCHRKRLFTRIISKVNSEAKVWRNIERKKFTKKATHLKEIKEKEEIRELEKCPQEIKEFENLSIFKKVRIEAMVKQKVEVSSIGEVELDDVLSLPPKFAVRKRLNSVEMTSDVGCPNGDGKS